MIELTAEKRRRRQIFCGAEIEMKYETRMRRLGGWRVSALGIRQ
jgi:hypothetical protein